MTNVGLFVDLENIFSSKCGVADLRAIVNFARERGSVLIRRVYMTKSDPVAIEHSRLAGFHVVVIPSKRKKPNNVDIFMVVDIMDHASRKDIGTIILASGDGDFEAAIVRLRENGKRVVVIAHEGSVSGVLRSASDEFMPYDTLTGYSRCVDSNAAGFKSAKYRNLISEPIVAVERFEPHHYAPLCGPRI